MSRIDSRTVVAVVLLGMASACVPDEPERPRGQQEGATPLPAGTAARAAAGAAGEDPATEPAPIQLFDAVPEPGGPPRTTYHVLVAAGASRAGMREAIIGFLRERAQEDPSAVALRVVGYVGLPGPGREAALLPVVWGEWVPPGGWSGATEASRTEHHRFHVYHREAPEW